LVKSQKIPQTEDFLFTCVKNVSNNIEEPQQIPTIVNRFAVLSETASDCDQLKQTKVINYEPKTRNKMEAVVKNKILLMGVMGMVIP
jgi:hypothetical protein